MRVAGDLLFSKVESAARKGAARRVALEAQQPPTRNAAPPSDATWLDSLLVGGTLLDEDGNVQRENGTRVVGLQRQKAGSDLAICLKCCVPTL